MYKDRDKQREANRERQRRYKAKQKALLSEGVTEGVTEALEGQRQQQEGYISPTSADNLKRGKDIKCFADLPPDVQAIIRRISESNEEFEKRTKAAIKYQHLFPDRYHSTGISI